MLVVLLLPVVCRADSDATADAAQLIGEARRFDGIYCGLQQEDREKAIAAYEAALRANPDHTQTLEVLFRLAQLHGTNYQIPKGEKPRYGQAMQLYQRIVSEYPHDEPLSMKSLICIGDICVTQWRFVDALRWYDRALEVNMDDLLQQQDAMRDDSDHRAEFERVTARMDRLQFYQSCAVEAISYTAMRIDPSVRDGLLESILRRRREEHVREAVVSALAASKVELFPLPAGLEEMTPYTEPAVQTSSVIASPTPAIDIEPVVAAAPEASASYRDITVVTVATIVVIAGAFIFYRRIRNHSTRKAS